MQKQCETPVLPPVTPSDTPLSFLEYSAGNFQKSSYFIIGYTQRSQSRARAEPPFCISLGGVLPHILPPFFH